MAPNAVFQAMLAADSFSYWSKKLTRAKPPIGPSKYVAGARVAIAPGADPNPLIVFSTIPTGLKPVYHSCSSGLIPTDLSLSQSSKPSIAASV